MIPDNRRRWTRGPGTTVFENRWISLHTYDAIAPTGAHTDYGVVHMKNLALGVLPIDDQGCTRLVGQERFVFDQYSWELPEGGGDPALPPIEGAKRELSEEAGLKADHWLPLFENVQLSNSVTDERAFAFIAWGLSPDSSWEKDPSEDLAVRHVPFSEAVAMAVSGEISDAFSLVMLLKADHLARTGALPGPLQRLLLAGG
ncbi:MAG: NUDIX domain-containing protein [Alphaproteobacteria bacterium]|nr:NUDIX domain-containing protein [Alphaproteobacteria bacterium]